MQIFSPTRNAQSVRLHRIVAALCVFLVLLVGIAQLAHTHPASHLADSDCALCAVAHLTAMPAAFAARPVVAEHLRPFHELAAIACPSNRAAGAFYIRPPPALMSHA